MIYNKILQNLLFPVSSILTKRKFWSYYLKLNESQWLSRDKIRKIQLDKLKIMVDHAYINVPFYNQKLKELNIVPSDIKELKDIKKLPIITKQDFSSHFPKGCTARNFPKSEMIYDSTSGSTGSPFQFIRHAHSSDMVLANTIRNYTWTGYKIGDKILSLWGYHPVNLVTKIYEKIIRRKMLSCFNIDENIKDYYLFLKGYRPILIESYSSAITKFAKLLKRKKLLDLKIPAIISSAETLYPENKALIEEILNTKVFNRYGSREIGNVSQECEKREGLHINDEQFIVEYINDDNDVKEGEKGRLIITDLDNFAMPFIRYDTEDYGVPTSKTCSCGRGLTLMKSIEGRVTDFIKLKGNKELSFLFFNYFFEQYGNFVNKFQIIQETEDKLTVKLVTTDNFNNKKKQEIIDGIAEQVGKDIKIKVEEVPDIKLAKSGKIRTVISKIK